MNLSNKYHLQMSLRHRTKRLQCFFFCQDIHLYPFSVITMDFVNRDLHGNLKKKTKIFTLEIIRCFCSMYWPVTLLWKSTEVWVSNPDYVKFMYVNVINDKIMLVLCFRCNKTTSFSIHFFFALNVSNNTAVIFLKQSH